MTQEQGYVSPPRKPRYKATVLFDPRSLYYADESLLVDPKLAEQPSDKCAYGHDLVFLKAKPKHIRLGESVICNRCRCRLPDYPEEKKEGYGCCNLCKYYVCHDCLKMKLSDKILRLPPTPPDAPPLPPNPDRELPYTELPEKKNYLVTWHLGQGQMRVPRKLFPPPVEKGLKLPHAPGDFPPCASNSVKWLKEEWASRHPYGLEVQPPTTAIKAVAPEALLGGQPGRSGAPLGRLWVMRGDDIVERQATTRPLRMGQLVAWHDRSTRMLRLGRVVDTVDGKDSYMVRPEPSQQRRKGTGSKKSSTDPIELSAVHLCPIDTNEAADIRLQMNILETEFVEVVSRLLSLIDGCSHADGPYIHRTKGDPSHGLHCEYLQCRWCGKVLAVRWKETSAHHGVHYYQMELDEVGLRLLPEDPHADFREDVPPPLLYGSRRQGGRGWTRKGVLLLPELNVLHQSGLVSTADYRQLAVRRANAEDVSTFELLWCATPLRGSWEKPVADAQRLFGPSLLVPGAQPLTDPSMWIDIQPLLRARADEQMRRQQGGPGSTATEILHHYDTVQLHTPPRS